MLYSRLSLESVLRQHPAFAKKILEILNNVPSNRLISEGRVYGGGLHKLEPRELAHIPVTAISEIVKNAKEFALINIQKDELKLKQPFHLA